MSLRAASMIIVALAPLASSLQSSKTVMHQETGQNNFKACIDLSGDYSWNYGATQGTTTLVQNGCSGAPSDNSWTYTVSGNTATMNSGITGTIEQSGGLTKITWSNGYVYTQACIDLSGDYSWNYGATQGTTTLVQNGCSGAPSDNAWTYTVSGNTATMDNGLTGTIAQSGGSTTITWSNGYVYTQTPAPTTAPTPAPTLTPTAVPTPAPTAAPLGCKSWCPYVMKNLNSDQMKYICNEVNVCAGCSGCVDVPVCHGWCTNSRSPWTYKCNFEDCVGCSPCQA